MEMIREVKKEGVYLEHHPSSVYWSKNLGLAPHSHYPSWSKKVALEFVKYRKKTREVTECGCLHA